MLREWILAVLFAVSAVLMSVGFGVEYGAGVGMIVGGVLLASLSYVVVSDDGVTQVEDEAVDEVDDVVTEFAPRRTKVTGALKPSEMTPVALEEVDDG